MKKQISKAKRLTEAKHLKTVKRRQLSEIKKSIRKYKRLNENEGENRFVGQTGDLPGEESMANRDIKALEELLKKYSIEKINITLRILDDPTHWKNPEIRTPEEKEMFQNRNAKKTGNMYTPGAEHPLNEVKNSLKKTLLTERFQQLAGIKPLYENEDLYYVIYKKGNKTGEIVNVSAQRKYGPNGLPKDVALAAVANANDSENLTIKHVDDYDFTSYLDEQSVNEDLRGLMAQGEKMAAFANKQSGYEGGVSSPVRGVLAAMTAAGAPDFDGDEELKSYWTRRLTKAIETQKGRKYMSGFSEEVNEIDESATQYLAIMRDLYPGKSWEELTPDERFKVRSRYEDFN